MTTRRIALLILGMHRSGTSALTRVLSLCGAALPRQLIPASTHNERGYFESRAIWEQHEQLLDEAGTSWHDPSPFPTSWFATPAAEAWVLRMAETVRAEYDESPVFVLKDPRLCRLLPFWRRVLAEVDAEPLCVLPLRHPREVAASLSRSERIAEQHALLLWLDYLLTAERDSRELPRSFVLFDRLLGDWRAVVGRIENDLGYRFPRRSRTVEAEIEGFLEPALRHERARGTEGVGTLHPWLDAAWRWCLEAGTEGVAPAEPLDRLAALWRDAESAFGPALAAVERARRAAQADARAAREQAREQHAALEQALATEAASREELRTRVERQQAALERARAAEAASRQELHARLEQHRALERALADEAAGRQKLHARLERCSEELARVQETARMLLRWVVERGRGESAAPGPLRAALDAFTRAHPLEAPALAAAALQIADQRLELDAHQRERAARAAELERVATRASTLENRLREARQRAAELEAALAALRGERAAERGELERARRELRELAATARAASAESERLAAEAGRWMARAAALEDELRAGRSGRPHGRSR